MNQKTYIAIDLKSFYASVECMERGMDPLTTNLVVADAAKTEKTICLAVTPSLKSYGISGRARLFEVVSQVKIVNTQRKAKIRNRAFEGKSWDAKELDENPYLALDYIAAPPRMALYRECSTKVVECYLKYVSIDDLYAYSIDEVFIDATPYLDKYKMTSRELAKMLIQEVLSSTGITATAGIAENMYLCKVALDITAKHISLSADGVRIAELDRMTYRRTLWEHRDLTDFWMIGKGTAKRLTKLGLYTLGDVARCSLYNEEILYREFGKNAQYIIDQAWGREPVTIADIKVYKPEHTSVSSGQVLTRPYTFGETRIVVREMVESLVLGLVSKNLVTDQIVLQLGYDIENLKDPVRRNAYKGEIVTDAYGRQLPKQARGTANMEKHTSSTMLVTQKTLEVFDRVVDHNLLTRRLTLSANHLIPEREVEESLNMRQLTLFDNVEEMERKEEEAKVKEEMERRTQKMMIDIKGRFGSNAILKGTNFQEGATGRERNKTIGGHKA